jgi:hypothetical protein
MDAAKYRVLLRAAEEKTCCHGNHKFYPRYKDYLWKLGVLGVQKETESLLCERISVMSISMEIRKR